MKNKIYFLIKKARFALMLSLALCLFCTTLHSQDTTEFTLGGYYGGPWHDANNWTNGLPDNNTVAVIPDGKTAGIEVDISVHSVVVEGNVRLFSGNNLEVLHNVLIRTDGDIDHDGNNLIIHQDLKIDGSFDVNSSSTVTFTGSTDGTISGAAANDMKNMVVNKNGADVLLGKDLTISKSCTFISGNIITNGRTLHFADDATVSGYGPQKFVIGTVEKVGDDNFVFPIGTIENDTNYYAPIGIDNTSGATTDRYSAKYYNEAHSGQQYFDPANHAAMEGVSSLEYWDVQQTSGTSTPKITLYWDDGDESGITNPASLVVAHWDPLASGTDKWENFSNTATSGNGGAGNSGSVTSGAVTGFSSFTFASTSNTDDNPLPVELLDFILKCAEDHKAELSWNTASEINNDHFEVQVADDDGVFNTVKQIDGHGNSNEMISYSCMIKLDEGVKYIRLKQVDYDGKFETFDPVAVNCSSHPGDVDIYPNPTDSRLDIALPSINGSEVSVSVYTTSGTRVFSSRGNAESGVMQLHLPQNMPAGIYFVRITAGEKHYVKKIRKN